jgi:hypothetical protein
MSEFWKEEKVVLTAILTKIYLEAYILAKLH